MLIITKENFKECVDKYETLIIDFYADWCNPCTALSAIIDRVAKNYPNVTFGKVNIDEEEELAMGFEVRSIPFVVKIKNGKIVDSFVGLHPESFVEEFFAK